MHGLRILLLGFAVYAGTGWVLVMTILFAFSLMLIREPTYCHPRLSAYEYLLPARPLACLLFDPARADLERPKAGGWR